MDHGCIIIKTHDATDREEALRVTEKTVCPLSGCNSPIMEIPPLHGQLSGSSIGPADREEQAKFGGISRSLLGPSRLGRMKFVAFGVLGADSLILIGPQIQPKST